MELGCARVSTVKQDLDRQIDALEQTGIPRDRIYVDKKSGATTDRPGLREVIAYAREGDVIVVHYARPPRGPRFKCETECLTRSGRNRRGLAGKNRQFRGS